MALKHKKVSNVPDGSDASLVLPSDWNASHVVDTDGVDMAVSTSTPAAPAAGNVRAFGRNLGGRSMLATVGEEGLVSTLQPHFGRNKVAFWLPSGNSNNVTYVGMPPPNATGNTRAVGTANLFQSMRRIGFASGATANSNANYRSNGLQFFLGSAPGLGGFHYICRFGTSNIGVVTDGRVFIGLSSYNGSMGSVNPSTNLNILGIGYDAGDLNWAIFSNDLNGLATKVDLGVNFPCTTQSIDAYELVMYAPPNSTTVKWAVTRLNTGDFATGTFSADNPGPNVLLQPHFNINSGPSAIAVQLDLMSLYIETDS